MHSCKLITNFRTKKVLCHHVEVVKNFRCCTTGCVFPAIRLVERKQPILMKPDRLVERHQTLSSLVGSQHNTKKRREKDAGEEEEDENFNSQRYKHTKRDFLCTYFAVVGSTSTIPLLSVLSSSVMS